MTEIQMDKALQQQVAEARAAIEAQREFLLTNVWKPGDPQENAMEHIGMKGVQLYAVGCLVERCTAKLDQLESDRVGYLSADYEVAGIWNEVANYAILWTLMEMGYDTPGPGVLVPTGYPILLDHGCHARDICIGINDKQFTQPGEAIEVLERALANIKEAFGEEG